LGKRSLLTKIDNKEFFTIDTYGDGGFAKHQHTGANCNYSRRVNLTPFGRAFNPGVFHALPVAIRATKNRPFRFSSLELCKAKLEIYDGLIDPHLTSTPRAAILVFLRRRAERDIP